VDNVAGVKWFESTNGSIENQNHDMKKTCDLPTIKKLEIKDEPYAYGLLRFVGIMIAAALSCLTFIYC
jgi:hypothetical protein